MRTDATGFECVLPRMAPAGAAATARPSPPGFRDLLGEAAWMRLVPAIRARFLHAGAAAESIDYTGTMERVDASFAGFLMAQFLRLLGTPLAPHRGRNVAVDVRVYGDERLDGVVWERIYRFPGKAPVTVRSTKVFTREFGLIECIDRHLGMRLRVFERDRALHFLSTGYFFRAGRWLLPLPLFITPGTAHVVHTDEGGGRFRFTMSVDHPLFGRTFFQDGVFSERDV